jgi:PAS domain S-box-containing protein
MIARTLRYAIERKRLELGVRTANEALERRVTERTAELEIALTILNESLSSARALAETASDAIITAGREGTIVGWNRAAERMFGYAQSEALGQPLTLVMPERYRSGHLVGVKRVQAGGERRLVGRTREFHGLTKAGSEFPLELSVSTWEGSEGRMFAAIIRDVSERKRAQEALRAAEEQFRGMVEQSIAGIYIIQDDKFAYVNPRFAEILGYGSADELIGREPLSIVAEKDRGVVAENIRRRIEGEVQSISYSFTALRKDGSPVAIGVHGTRASYRGRPAIIGLMQDISEKKRAEEKIQHYVAQIESAFMRTVEVAMTLGEMRDPYTAGHERRVAEIAVAIGAELGFDARRLEGLQVAGYLHDIGKITIPSEILVKPAKLNPVEYQLIQGHSQAGYDVLKDVEFPWPVAEVALQHHERMDGSGYPLGLKGEAILLEARILGVADVVEAMSSHRPYRATLGIEAALAEIERGRGTAYDPSVADACLRLFREKSYTIPA